MITARSNLQGERQTNKAKTFLFSSCIVVIIITAANLHARKSYRTRYETPAPLYDRKGYGNETVNPHDFHFIQQPLPCTENQTLLVSIHSAAENHLRRKFLRNAWVNPGILQRFLPNGDHVKIIFLIALPSNTTVQKLIDYEFENYQDIVQINFIDSYENNTYKAIYHMKWVSSNEGCPNVKLVIKADDDILFNLKNFPKFWKSFTGQLGEHLDRGEAVLAGHEIVDNLPQRNPVRKWYVSYKEYRYKTYPRWYQGMVYFFTPVLARWIYKFSFTTPYLYTDDVYIGIVADRVDGIFRLNIPSPYIKIFREPLDDLPAWKNSSEKVFYHSKNISEMYLFWNAHWPGFIKPCRECLYS